MNLIESAEEALKTVVDKTKEDKKYDEKVVLQETNQKLLDLKEDVSYATVVLEQLKKTNWVDEQKFQALEAKLRDNNTKQEAIEEIARIIEDINARYENLHADEKEKVRKMTEALHETNKSISALKKEVMENPNYEAIEKELVDEAMKKLDEHRYTRWLKEPYKKYIHEQIEEMKSGKKGEEKKGWKKFVDGLSKWFFGLVGAMFIGKSITDLVADKLNVAKDKIKEGGKKVVDKVKEKIKDVKEKTPEVPAVPKTAEELQEEEAKAKRYIKVTVKKYFKKDLTDEQVDRIAKKMNLSQQLKEGTSEWSKIIHENKGNYFDATAQTIAMPFQIFGQLVGVLQEEGIVDMKDVALHMAGETVEYGLKGFELFGAGLATVCGKMDLKELNGHIAHLYEKSPTAAKQILFALIYRSMDGPLMKMVLNTGAFMAKAVMWPLVEAKGDMGLVKNMAQDALKGNMNTAIRDMKETKELLKKCNVQDPFLDELMEEIERAAKKAEVYNSIVVEAQGVSDGSNFMKELKKKFPAGSDEQKFITDYEKSISRTTIDKARFLDNLGATWENETKIMKSTMASVNGKWGVEFKNWGAKMFLGESSVRHLMINFANNIEAQGKVAHEMLANRNLFDQLSHKMYLKKVRAMGEIMHGNELKDKAVWKFNTVEELADFTENAKLLARKAPSTLKFLLGKAPIFIVGGLAMGEGDTLSEKMHGLYEGLMGLVPIAGPLLVIRDGLWAGDNTNWGQAAVGGALLGVDAVHIFKAFKGGQTATKLIQMFTQPVVDMIEIGKFLRNSGKNTVKMVLDGAKLVREGKMLGAWEKLLATLKGTPKKKWAVMAAVAAFGGWAIAEMIPDGIDKEAEVLFTKYKNDPEGLDRALAESWPTLDQDTKNECLKYALIAKLGISPEHADQLIVEYKEGSYHVSLPMMIQKEYGNAMLASLKDSIARVEPNAKIEMSVRGAVAYNFRKQLEEKLKAEGEKPENIPGIVDKQLEAMGYNPGIGKETKA